MRTGTTSLAMSNRVEELEKTVRELRATVNGLTEELVETKERLRELEGSAEVQVTRSEGRSEPSASSAQTATGDVGVVVETDEEDKAPEDQETDEDAESEPQDGDIIVA